MQLLFILTLALQLALGSLVGQFWIWKRFKFKSLLIKSLNCLTASRTFTYSLIYIILLSSPFYCFLFPFDQQSVNTSITLVNKSDLCAHEIRYVIFHIPLNLFSIVAMSSWNLSSCSSLTAPICSGKKCKWECIMWIFSDMFTFISWELCNMFSIRCLWFLDFVFPKKLFMTDLTDKHVCLSISVKLFRNHSPASIVEFVVHQTFPP